MCVCVGGCVFVGLYDFELITFLINPHISGVVEIVLCKLYVCSPLLIWPTLQQTQSDLIRQMASDEGNHQ